MESHQAVRHTATGPQARFDLLQNIQLTIGMQRFANFGDMFL
jgi:hypothetical protein